MTISDAPCDKAKAEKILADFRTEWAAMKAAKVSALKRFGCQERARNKLLKAGYTYEEAYHAIIYEVSPRI